MATSSRHRAPGRPPLEDGDHAPGAPASYPRLDLLAATGGALLLVVIAVLSGWAHHSLANPRPVPPHAGAPAPATGVAEPRMSAHAGLRLRDWLTRAEPSIDALAAARRTVTAAAAGGDLAATGVACTGADAAVTGAQRQLPSPDPDLNAALQRAIESYLVGLRHCVVGVRQHDGIEIARAAGYIDQGNRELRAALAILDRDLPGVQPREPGVLTV